MNPEMKDYYTVLVTPLDPSEPAPKGFAGHPIYYYRCKEGCNEVGVQRKSKVHCKICDSDMPLVRTRVA